MSNPKNPKNRNLPKSPDGPNYPRPPKAVVVPADLKDSKNPTVGENPKVPVDPKQG
jgi:hypothetical protein